MMIDADLAELVDDNRDAATVIRGQDTVQECRLSGAEKTGQNSHGYSLIINFRHALEIPLRLFSKGNNDSESSQLLELPHRHATGNDDEAQGESSVYHRIRIRIGTSDRGRIRSRRGGGGRHISDGVEGPGDSCAGGKTRRNSALLAGRRYGFSANEKHHR